MLTKTKKTRNRHNTCSFFCCRKIGIILKTVLSFANARSIVYSNTKTRKTPSRGRKLQLLFEVAHKLKCLFCFTNLSCVQLEHTGGAFCPLHHFDKRWEKGDVLFAKQRTYNKKTLPRGRVFAICAKKRTANFCYPFCCNFALDVGIFAPVNCFFCSVVPCKTCKNTATGDEFATTTRPPASA